MIYVRRKRHDIQPLYTLIFGTWERGDNTYGYTYGDRDTIYHPYTLSFFLETLRLWDSTQGYTSRDRDTIYQPYTHSFFETWRRWVMPRPPNLSVVIHSLEVRTIFSLFILKETHAWFCADYFCISYGVEICPCRCGIPGIRNM